MSPVAQRAYNHLNGADPRPVGFTSQLILHYRDDGQGLDLRKLEALGRQLDLLTPRSSDQDVTERISRLGLSTKDWVSEISGRGVRVDAVRNYSEEAGGRFQCF